ncbi:diacylglycerol/polyprenol kinase family protein [archaeon]
MIIDLETRRQAVHLFSGLFFASVVHLTTMEEGFAFLGIAALLTFAFSKMIKGGKKVPFLSWLVDKTERKGKPPASGVTWYFLGVLFIFVASMYLGIAKEFVVAAMLIVAIGDSICTGLGRKIGRKKLPRTKTKSYEGSLVGFGAAFFGAAFVLKLLLPTTEAMIIAGAGAIVGMIAEAYLTMIDDNLSIPILAWLAMVIAASVIGAL